MFFMMILGAHGAMAQDTGSCEEWGTIQPTAETSLNFGETVDFFVRDMGCGDLSQCTRSLSPDELGSLSTYTGGSVQLTTISDLGDCLPQDLLLSIACPSDDGTMVNGDHYIELSCSEAQKESILGAQNWSIGGGGCGTGSVAALVFPSLLCPFLLARRRQD